METTTKILSYLCVIFVFFYTFTALAENEVINKNTDPKVQELVTNVKKGDFKHLSAKDLEAVAFQKMNPEQISNYLKTKVENKDDSSVQILVPIAMFAIIPLCIFVLFFFRTRISREKQLTLRAMVENGAQIPPEMFLDSQKNANPMDRDRRRGLLFTLSSVGFIVFLLVIENAPKGLWALGLIPLLLGIGYLVSWKLANNESTQG